MSATDQEQARDRADSALADYEQHIDAANAHLQAAASFRQQGEGALVVQHADEARIQASLAQAAATAAVAGQVAALNAFFREQAR